jgi:ABC-type proline/glycine betaine transport system permease subunit
MTGPDPRRRTPREIVAALLGAEVGAGIGLLAFGGRELAPLALAVSGALAGPLIAIWLRAMRTLLMRRAMRRQLRAGS